MRIGPLLQYFCSTCGKVLKESSSLYFQNDQLKEECPSCGSSLINSLQNRMLYQPVLEPQQSVMDTNQKAVKALSVDFQTAYRQVETSAIRLTFDVERMDSLLNLSSHGTLCIIGEQMYTQLLIDRLCVHSMLPRRHGGIGEGYSKIIAIDAGNCSDVYQIVNFARQYGLEIKRVLQNIHVSRVFTIYQLAHLISHELPSIIGRVSSDRKNHLIVIYGLLHLFVSDPHIDRNDAKQLIKEIATSIRKISEDRFVVASTTHSNLEYETPLFSVFDSLIRITNGIENSKVLRVNVHIQNRPVGGRGIRSAISTKFCRRDLLLVPPR